MFPFHIDDGLVDAIKNRDKSLIRELLKDGRHSLANAIKGRGDEGQEGKGREVQEALEEMKDFLFEVVIVDHNNWDDVIAMRRRGLDIKLEYKVKEEVVKKFHEHCGWGYGVGNLEEVKKMVKEEGHEILNQPYADDWSNYKNTPLMTASAAGHDAIVSFMIQSGVDLHAKGETNGSAAIHSASGNGRLSTAKILLAAGANPEAKTKEGSTPLRWAIYGGTKECEETAVALIEEGASVEAAYEGSTILQEKLANMKRIAPLLRMNRRGEANFLQEKTGDPFPVPQENVDRVEVGRF
jgi:hypothetical protein